jgi:hypothetical protein
VITRADAINYDIKEFHHNTRTGHGGCQIWQRNGKAQTWGPWSSYKYDFRIPVYNSVENAYQNIKYSTHGYSNNEDFHTSANCPHNNKEENK